MSQEDFKEKTIDGFTYKVMMLDPLTSSDMLTDLIKVAGPLIGSAGNVIAVKKDALGDALDGGDKDVGVAVEKSLIGLIGNIEKTKIREFITILSKVTMVIMDDGKTPLLSNTFDQHFRGRLFSMYKWLAFAMRTQWSDFFDSLGVGTFGNVLRMATVQSNSQSTSESTT